MKTLNSGENSIIFRHLYDTTWGCFALHRGEKWVVFPQDFQPEIGKKYNVNIFWTMTGIFNYKGKEYSVARAYLKESAGIIGSMLYKIDNKPKKIESPLAAAFKKAGLAH